MSEESPTGQPQPPRPPPPASPPPASPPTTPPANGPSPPGQEGPGRLWMWIFLGVLMAAGLAVGAYFLLTGNEVEEVAPIAPAGNRVTISVQTGPCHQAAGTTPIEVAIDPPDGAEVTVTGGDGFQHTFTGAGGALPVEPGEYAWAAQPARGFTVAGSTSGTLSVPLCGEAQPGFSARELELLGHVPSDIRDTCQRIPPEQALGRAAAGILCEHQETTLFYDLFPNASEMETYYSSRVREFGVSPGLAFCDTAERAENAYVRQRGGSEFEVGRLLCFRDAGSAVFIWTDRRVDISVEAQRGDPTNDRLYRLWARIEFGPLA